MCIMLPEKQGLTERGSCVNFELAQDMLDKKSSNSENVVDEDSE